MKPRTKQRRRRENTVKRFRSVVAGVFRGAGLDCRAGFNSNGVHVLLEGNPYEACLHLDQDWLVFAGEKLVVSKPLEVADDFDLEALAQRFVQIIRDQAERKAAEKLAEILS